MYTIVVTKKDVEARNFFARKTFTQLLMATVEKSKLAYRGLIFIDLKVKVPGNCYCKLLL